jgi:hypothetical protein
VKRAVADRGVRVRYLPTGTVHLVWAAGGPEDGSLYGFQTHCGRRIEDPDQWQEGRDWTPAWAVLIASPWPNDEPMCRSCLGGRRSQTTAAVEPGLSSEPGAAPPLPSSAA